MPLDLVVSMCLNDIVIVICGRGIGLVKSDCLGVNTIRLLFEEKLYSGWEDCWSASKVLFFLNQKQSHEIYVQNRQYQSIVEIC